MVLSALPQVAVQQKLFTTVLTILFALYLPSDVSGQMIATAPPDPGIPVEVRAMPACGMGPDGIKGAEIAVATARVTPFEGGEFWYHDNFVANGKTDQNGFFSFKVPEGKYVISARSGWYCNIGGCNAFFGQIFVVVKKGFDNSFQVYLGCDPDTVLGRCLGLIPGHDATMEENIQKNCQIQFPKPL